MQIDDSREKHHEINDNWIQIRTQRKKSEGKRLKRRQLEQIETTKQTNGNDWNIFQFNSCWNIKSSLQML